MSLPNGRASNILSWTITIVDHYYKNKVQRYDRYVLAKFCTALSCDISDILELCPEDTDTKAP